jgi:hypothetical protein
MAEKQRFMIVPAESRPAVSGYKEPVTDISSLRSKFLNTKTRRLEIDSRETFQGWEQVIIADGLKNE